jgi:hypothetical protein
MDEHAMSTYLAGQWAMMVPAFFAGGVLLGYGYFRALHKTTDMLLGKGSMLLVLALTLARVAAIGMGFYLAVLVGAPALIAAFAGAMLGRALILRRGKGGVQ